MRVVPALLAGLLVWLPLRRGASMERWFGEGVSGGRWLLHVALTAALGLAVALCLYLARTPGLLAALWESDLARGPFLSNLLGSGLPLLVVVNFFAAMLWALSHRARPGRGAVPALLLDLGRRVAVFALATALYLAGPKLMGGSAAGFGDAGEALLRAPGFRDLTGVYLLGALLAPLPLWASALGSAARGNGAAAVSGGVAALAILLALVG